MRTCGEVYLGIPLYELCVWVERVGLLLLSCCFELRSKRSGTKKIFVRFGQRYDSYKTAGYRRIGIHLSHTHISSVSHAPYCLHTTHDLCSNPYNQDASIPIAVMVVPFNIDESLVKDAVDDRRDTIWRIGPNHHSCYNTICCESSHYEYHQSTNRSGPNDQNEFRSTTPIRKIEFSFLLLL